MKISIEFDLSKDEDRKMYNSWIKMKEITLNLESFQNKLKNMSVWYLDESWEKAINENFIEIKSFFEEMIWKKLT